MSLSPFSSTTLARSNWDTRTWPEFPHHPETSSHLFASLRVAADQDAGLPPSRYREAFERTARSGQLIEMVALAVEFAASQATNQEMPEWWVGFAPHDGRSPDWVPTWWGTSEDTGVEGSSLQARVSWRLYLDIAKTCREITDLLRGFGRTSVANRIDFLQGLHDEDADEPPLEFESLRTLACFVLSEGKLPDPEIGLTPRGLAVGQWRIPPDGILAMEFHSHDWIRFAGVGCTPQPPDQRRRISGEMAKHQVVGAVRDFTGLLARHS